MMEIFDVFLLEAVLNGILLGGLLALLSLGLNLIFGVIDVVWICYAEMIMIGMYAVYALHVQQQWPLVAAMAAGIAIVALLGALMHQFVIRPVLAAEPINQLLVTGGMLFFLQAAATLAFGIEFKNLGVKMAPLAFGEMSFSAPRLIAFAVAVAGVAATYLFLTRTYTGTAIRAISQDRQIMPLMGVNPDRIFTITSALGGALAGLGGCLLVLQYDIHPAIGLSFGPITFLICVLGGLGNMLGGLIAAFIFAQFISVGGFFFHIEWGYVIAFVFFIAVMFWRPQGILGGKQR
jgi:branched-chain amino acid transport system permease protein